LGAQESAIAAELFLQCVDNCIKHGK
jgi:hypothetical protein